LAIAIWFFMTSDHALIHHFAAKGGPTPVPLLETLMTRALNTYLVRVDMEAGLVVLHFTPGETFLQGHGVVQGGAVAAMLDYAMAFAAMSKIDLTRTVVTANLNVSFLRSAQAGLLMAFGEVERVGKTLAFTRAKLCDSEGRLIATATSTLPILTAR
jgi:uncharacterized protein (TIGR00369 family)